MAKKAQSVALFAEKAAKETKKATILAKKAAGETNKARKVTVEAKRPVEKGKMFTMKTAGEAKMAAVVAKNEVPGLGTLEPRAPKTPRFQRQGV